MKAKIRRHHQEWLDLLDRSGPFLTVPVLTRVWPAGLDPLSRDSMDDLRPEFDRWRDQPAAGLRRWVTFVLSQFLEWRECLVEGTALPPGLNVAVPEHEARVQADFAFRELDGALRLLGMILAPGTRPSGRTTGGWSASPADRLAILLRRHRVPIGLVTDGRWWTLVWAPAGGATSITTWDGSLWLEERETLRAFRCLLERRRFLGVAESDTLPALLEDGLGEQEEVTESLGRQVRQAVEMLVEAIGRAGRPGGPSEDLLRDVDPDAIYHGAVSVMMRLLFLFFAEERLLLPADDELYLHSYSAGRLVDALREEANLAGEEQLEHRTAAWQRLLTLFRVIHRGLAHDRLRIPAYGGVVFDPNRHPWLEGRPDAGAPDTGSVLPVDDRTVLHALDAVQYVVASGERRRLSFRTLDVEQIGYVYEGLLGYDAMRATEPVLGLQGRLGEEQEVGISELEEIGVDPAKIHERIGLSESRVKKLLASPDPTQESLLRVACSGDEELMTRVRPFAGLLRLDLRGLPIVVPEGGIYVTESSRRRLSGTHYTPRELAEKVVVGALEPLVYNPGPLDTADRSRWKLRPSHEILALRVADIAMGSGAFLVSACRYLAGKLIEARAGEGDPRAAARPGTEGEAPVDPEWDPVVIEARREVMERCLYGGDINDMAVEMAKLSLWLVSLSREKPFSFLDDRMTCGDSLLGLTSLDQLRTLHLDPKEARRRAGERGFDLWGEMEGTLREVERLRRELREHPLVDARDARVKERLLDEAEKTAQPLRVIADAMVGIAMAAAGARRDANGDLEAFASTARHALRDRGDPLEELKNIAVYQLDTDRPQGAFERRPTHWPLVFPEVFEVGGFDAVIGNPPFLGGRKISGAMGDAYREYLVVHVANGVRGGSTDLLAYFLLVANDLLNERGQTGLIGTNTMAQGDTREVALDQIVADGATIRAAIKSAKWPTRMVNLEYAVVWSSRRSLADDAPRELDGRSVSLILSALDEAEANLGTPFRLVANQGIAFQGSIVLGLGFTMSPDDAEELIKRDPRNRDVLFPYITGEDLNSRPDCSASRWVVDFRDRSEHQAKAYPDCWSWVEERVKPERISKDRKKYPRMVDEWWQHWNMRPALHRAIEGLSQVVATTQTSQLQLPARLPTGWVYAHKIVVFARDEGSFLALISSNFHRDWVIVRGSTLRRDPVYTPTDVFETFPQPVLSSRMDAAGEALDAHRLPLMLSRQLGLTALYNLVHSENEHDPDIERLREIHVEVDEATAAAYGWDDLSLDHGFHDTAQGIRFTISPAARREVLRRLLELNHQRHAEEEARGLTKKPKGRRRAQPSLPLREGA